MDNNGNGYLSLAEIDKALQSVLRCNALFQAKNVTMRAFQAAKDANKSVRERTTAERSAGASTVSPAGVASKLCLAMQIMHKLGAMSYASLRTLNVGSW